MAAAKRLRQVTLKELFACVSLFCVSLGLLSLQYSFGSPFPMSARVLFITACFASAGSSVGYPIGRVAFGTKRGTFLCAIVAALLSGAAGFLLLLYILVALGLLRV